MVNIIKIINTACLIYIVTNDKTRNVLLSTIQYLYAFLLKEINDAFKRQDEFIAFLVKGDRPVVESLEVASLEVASLEVASLEVNEEVSAVVKEDKFEDKYLQKFKAFKNEYSFTTDELQLEKQKYDELKAVFMKNKAKEIEDISWKITKLQRILDCVTIDENGTMTDVSEDGKRLLTKYYDIEEEYYENPENYMLSDLFSELSEILEETKQKLKEQDSQVITDEEFKEQAHQYMLNLKLDGYINNYVNEMTPLGNVYMRYNNSKKSFEYYSNNTIPYRYLEPVGRKFVLTYFCKPLFIDIEDELNKAQLKKDEEKDKRDNDKKENDKRENDKRENDKRENDKRAEDKKNIFAQLKTYNNSSHEMSKMGKQNVLPPQIKANLPNVNTSDTSKMLLKENANRYTWEGRLANMNLLKKVDRKVVDKKYAMSFADFKRLKM